MNRRHSPAAGEPDLILWPEASTPVAVKGDPGMQARVEALAARIRVPPSDRVDRHRG